MAVFDASVIVAVVVQASWSEDARRLLAQDTHPIAPDFVMVELANALWKNSRRGAISADRVIDSLREIPAALNLHPSATLIEPATRIAITTDHPVYNCLYLALARREGMSLVTADRRLAALAARSSITVELLS